MGRRYRKKNSASSIISDTAYIGSKLPWWGALLFGAFSFILFYFIVPAWLESRLASQSGSAFLPMLEAILGRRIHWFEWVGIACGLVGVFFGIRNFFWLAHAGSHERGIVAFFARMFGRDLS
jgi:hypothetical protein